MDVYTMSPRVTLHPLAPVALECSDKKRSAPARLDTLARVVSLGYSLSVLVMTTFTPRASSRRRTRCPMSQANSYSR